jgi:hypothetical protein
MRHPKYPFTARLALYSAFWLCVLILAACGQLTRQDLLEGNFGTVDKSPPKLISPLDNEVFDMGTVTFVWTANRFATEYTVEVAQDSQFTQPISGSPIISKNAMVSVALNEPYSYYWRVKNNLSDSYSETRHFHLLDGNLYVYCPPDKVTCSNANRYGNRSLPYEVIAPVTTIAKLLNKPVLVARRSNSVAYLETATISLQSGVTLKGGYDALTWTQDLSRPTFVRSSAAQAVTAVGIREATLLEGFFLQAEGDHALWVADASQALVIQSNTILGRLAAGTSRAVSLQQTSGVFRHNNIIAGAGFSTGRAIESIDGSSALIYNNLISGGIAATSGIAAGYWTTGGNDLLFQNAFYGGEGAYAYAIQHVGPNTNNLRVGLNLVYAGNVGNTGGNRTTAVSFNSTNSTYATPVFSNLLMGGRGQYNYGVEIGNAPSGFRLEQNIYFNWSHANHTGVCHHALNSPNLHASFRNNDLKNCTGTTASALFRGGGTNYTEICSSGAAFGNTSCGTTFVPTSSGVNTSGNRSETLGDTFDRRPVKIRFTGDGPDSGSGYNGGINQIELLSQSDCTDFVVGEYFQYGSDSTPFQIVSTSCSPSSSYVTFTPHLHQASAYAMPILLWGTTNSGYDRAFTLKTTSQNRNDGMTCNVSNFTVLTHRWGIASSQAECDAKFPLGSTYNSGYCQSQYLYPSMQIDDNGQPAGNLLCEANERCLYLQNIGKYQGHGSLIAACDVTSLLTGVQLMKFQDNGY